jgi:hypothetical protein
LVALRIGRGSWVEGHGSTEFKKTPLARRFCAFGDANASYESFARDALRAFFIPTPATQGDAPGCSLFDLSGLQVRRRLRGVN